MDGKWKVVNRTSENLQIKEYEPDPELTALLAPYDTRAKEDAVTPIGELKGGDLAPENCSAICCSIHRYQDIRLQSSYFVTVLSNVTFIVSIP